MLVFLMLKLGFIFVVFKLCYLKFLGSIISCFGVAVLEFNYIFSKVVFFFYGNSLDLWVVVVVSCRNVCFYLILIGSCVYICFLV